MCPVLFDVGGRTLYSYWFFYGLGMLAGVLLCIWLGRRRALPFGKLWLVCLLAVFAAFASARVAFVAFDPAFDPFDDLRHGGEVSFGAFAGALVVFAAAGALLRLPLRDLLDACAPSLFLAESIQRIGCYCNGCCYGPVYDSLLSVRFPKIINPDGDIIGTPCFVHHLATGIAQNTDLYSQPVIPIQFVSMGVALGVSVLGVILFRHRRFQGGVLWASLVLYGAARFGLQWFRPNYDADDGTFGWNIGHTASAAMFVVGLGFLCLVRIARGPGNDNR